MDRGSFFSGLLGSVLGCLAATAAVNVVDLIVTNRCDEPPDRAPKVARVFVRKQSEDECPIHGAGHRPVECAVLIDHAKRLVDLAAHTRTPSDQQTEPAEG